MGIGVYNADPVLTKSTVLNLKWVWTFTVR